MKKSFKEFLIETEFSGTPRFYHLLAYDLKQNGVVEKNKKDKKVTDGKEYKSLLTDYLRTVGSINK